MSNPKAKVYKLKPTDGVMTRDDVAMWEYTLLAACRQVADWVQFLPGQPKDTWKSTYDDVNNGLVAMKADGTGEDAANTQKLRAAFADFICCVAAHSPTSFMSTVVKESTSFREIIDEIKNTYGLNSKGEKFLNCMDIKLEFNETFTHEMGYMAVKDFFMSALLPKNSIFKGKTLDNAEILSPMTECFIMKEFLTKVHPKLPDHIKNTKGHLFTTDTPTLACNKARLMDLLGTMLQEIENLENISTNNLTMGQIMSGGRGGGPSRFPSRGHSNFRGNNFSRGGRPPFRGGRPPFPNSVNNRYQFRSRREDCRRCLEARRYDSSKGHETARCPFPPGYARTTPPSGPAGSNFKVLLVHDQQSSSNHPVEQLQHVPFTAAPVQVQENQQYEAMYNTPYSDQYYNEAYDDSLYNSYDNTSYGHQYDPVHTYSSYQGEVPL